MGFTPGGRTGAKNPNAKLDEKQVLKIHKLMHKGADAKELASAYEVQPNTIYCIKNKKAWRHLWNLDPAPRREKRS